MRKVKRWRYYCDFCNKVSGSSYHMKRHEKACTMNPDRYCRMCAMFDLEQAKIKKLLWALPCPNIVDDDFGITLINIKSAEKAMAKLREISNDCPACIMAAIRQKGYPVPAITSFNFTEECKMWWAEFNEGRFQEEDHHDYY